MRVRLANLWWRLRASFWFLPACMAVGAVVLALAAARWDEAFQQAEGGLAARLLYPGDREGARLLLSTVAGSMITVAGVVFSVTVVALSFASSQLGPRLLASFLRDRGNQLVLGTFIATFLFCLLALGSGPGTRDPGFVPSASASVGLLLAVVSVFVLIYFIHHVSSSLRADSVIDAVARDLEQAVERLFPEALEEADSEEREEEAPAAEGAAVRSERDGYVQAVDEAGLLAIATEEDLVLDVRHRAGHFVVVGEPLAVACGVGELPPALAERIRRRILIGRERTQEQDPEYGVHQLVQVAVRALSPGVHDPYTAIACVDWLGAIAARIGGRRLRSAARRDAEGTLRLRLDPVTFGGMLDAAFDQIRQTAGGMPAVSIRVLEALERVAVAACVPARRRAVADQAAGVREAALAGGLQGRDREDLEARYRAVREALGDSA